MKRGNGYLHTAVLSRRQLIHRIGCVCGVVAGSVLLDACGGSATQSASPAATAAGSATAAASKTAAAPKYFIKSGTVASVQLPNTIAQVKMNQLIMDRTNGEIKADNFADSLLGTEPQLFEGLINNTVQLAQVNLSITATRVPEGQIFDLPYLFNSEAHAYRVYSGPIGQSLAERYKPVGVIVLGYWLNGIRNVFGNFDISVDGIKGKKLRSVASPIHLAMWKALGAAPTAIPPAEQYLAYKQGVVDGGDTSLAAYFDLKLYEVTKNFGLTGHIYSIGLLGVSAKFWDTLPKDHQAVISAAAKEVIPMQNTLTLQKDEDATKSITAAGGNVVTNPDRAAFRAKMQPVWDEFKDKVGGMGVIQGILDTK